MRTLKLVVLGVLFLVGTTLTVNAQAPEAQAPAPTPQPPAQPAVQPAAQQTRSGWRGIFGDAFFNVSAGGQSREQVFNDTSTFDIYNEKGAVAAAHSIGGGTLFDFSVGTRVWKSLSVGIGYSTLKNFNEATMSVRVPHPVVFGQSRTATASVPDLEHSENVVHLQFMWKIPVMRKFDISVFAGPSFFTVRQTVAAVQAPQDIRDQAPFTTVTITTVSLTDVKDSPVGFNVGVDGTYLIRTIKGIGFGVGGFARFTGASLDLPTPLDMTRDTKLKAGGPQGGLGLRVRF